MSVSFGAVPCLLVISILVVMAFLLKRKSPDKPAKTPWLCAEGEVGNWSAGA
jgi:hypothetical protein